MTLTTTDLERALANARYHHGLTVIAVCAYCLAPLFAGDYWIRNDGRDYCNTRCGDRLDLPNV